MKHHFMPWLFLVPFCLAAGCSATPPDNSSAFTGGTDGWTGGTMSTGAVSGLGGLGGLGAAGFGGSPAGTGGQPACAMGQLLCGSVCQDVMSNPASCGACGVACAAGQSCQAGVCGCPVGTSSCAGGCVDLLTSGTHCGACDAACGAAQACSAGQCACQPGLVSCTGACVDLQTDANNCGACGTLCAAATPLCSRGACVASCQPGETQCGSSCVTLTIDPFNCGVCGQVCPGGACNDSVCGCQAGQKLCGAECTDVASNSANCGDCGVVCSGGQVCSAGTCSCPSGQINCSGACIAATSCPCIPECAGGKTCSNGTCACPAGLVDCAGVCTDTTVDAANCNACGLACTGGKACAAGSCVCPAGQEDCNGTCVADGNCATPCVPGCSGGMSCQNGTCVCPSGQTNCSGSCADLNVSPLHCGTCGSTCVSPKACSGGTCACPLGQTDCSGVCTDTASSSTHCGACGRACTGGQVCSGGTCACPTGQVLCEGTCRTGTTCPTNCSVGLGVISNFEEGSSVTPPIVKAQDGRSGQWERFFETDTNNFSLSVESSGNTDTCDQWALHARGTSSAGWGGWVGVGINLTGTLLDPNIYNASKYTGIRFKAKRGPGHDPKSAVRFNIPIPETEGTGSPGTHDACTDVAATAEKAARPCYQHMGRFLHVVSGYENSPYGDSELTTNWKTFTYCFDRDLYPLSLPTNLSNAQRAALASRILKIQFQFNQGKDWYVSSYPTEGRYTALAKNLPFDFWLNDIEFFDGACPSTNYQSSTGTTNPFPQNDPIGTCALTANAASFSSAISQAYARWTKNFVRVDGSNLRVIAPEQEGGVTTSESMGYGMLIAAAMGDKASFDKFWGYVQQYLSGGLMTWKPNGGSGSATDGDMDIAYALLMASAQWGGAYGTAANNMIAAIKSGDVSGSQLKPGNQWNPGYNPSYFAPSYMRRFGGMDAVIANSYSLLQTNINGGAGRFPTDWTDWSGNAVTGSSIGAQVTGGFTVPVYGYDAARVPWRIGLDGCISGGTGSTLAGSIVSYFAQRYDAGATIDLMKAGWVKSSGNAAASADGAVAKDQQGSFIGPLGVGAMAANNPAVRDRAFRAMLDILENGDFNHTYFPSTVGFITLLIMSGNFPLP